MLSVFIDVLVEDTEDETASSVVEVVSVLDSMSVHKDKPKRRYQMFNIS